MIAAVGDPAPGGGKFAGFGEWPSAGPAGRIAFVAAIDDGPGPIGIFAWEAGIFTRLVLAGEKLTGRQHAAAVRHQPGHVGRATTAPFPSRRWAIRELGAGSRIYYFGPPPR